MVDLPPLYTRIEYTSDSEYDPRNAPISAFGIHHGVTTSLQAIIDLSKPGGREVSMTLAVKDGERVLVVPIGMRPFTSASRFDHVSVTVEAANQTLAPDYLLSDATYESLAIIGAHLVRDYGVPLKIGVPGFYQHKNLYQWFEASYPTLCAGPHFDTQRVVNQTAALLAGGGSNTNRRSKTMYLARDIGGTIWLYTDNGRAAIPSMAHVQLFNRLLYGITPYDTFNAAELDIMQSYVITAGNSGSDAELAALQKSIAGIATPNPALIAKAIADAVIASINEQGVEVDTDAVALAVEKQLADEFAAIPQAVIDEIAS